MLVRERVREAGVCSRCLCWCSRSMGDGKERTLHLLLSATIKGKEKKKKEEEERRRKKKEEERRRKKKKREKKKKMASAAKAKCACRKAKLKALK